MLVRSIMNDRQTKEFDATKECNFAIKPQGIGRFRVSAFVQQAQVGAVIRMINTKIPTFEELELPPIMQEIVMAKRGLVIVVGGTGSGKSTTLAAMVGYRNDNSRGHIVTIEDPVEFVHPHRGLRRHAARGRRRHRVLARGAQEHAAPGARRDPHRRDPRPRDDGVRHPVRRDRPPVLATLHANNANQALDRIINFFPEERRDQLLMDLSLNIKALISQRLIPREGGKGRIAAMEIMLNSPLIADLIFKGEVAADQGDHGALEPARHEDLRPGPVRAVRGRHDLLRGGPAQRRLEERAAPAHQAREQARATGPQTEGARSRCRIVEEETTAWSF